MDYFFIGDPELATAFRFVGIQGLSVSTAEEALAAFKKNTKSCRVLIITEEIAAWLGETLTQWRLNKAGFPLVVEIPGILGHMSGYKTIVESIREAIGVHI